ncbi:MAG: hypothetical protein NTY14_03305 [Candidatus Omnitrophica bacterium]|nr:hypothetical protein [Candidatus Omnitrophota bacterium]
MRKIFYLLCLFCFLSSGLSLAQNVAVQESPANTTDQSVLPQDLQLGKKAIEPVQLDVSKAEPIIARSQSGKISLDIKGMDIVDVLKMLAARAGMNIIVGKNVRGPVSLFIKDVEIWDAFEIILLANGLAYDKKGNLINVMTQDDYEKGYGSPYKDQKVIETIRLKYAKAKDAVTALTQIKSDVGKVIVDESSNSLILLDIPDRVEKMKKVIQATDYTLETRIFPLNYANAAKISEKIKNMVTKGMGSINIDERTGKLAITDTPENLAEIEKVIIAFDERPKQVLINAQIIELNPSDKLEMGIDWDSWLEKYFRVSAPFAGVSGTTKFSIGTIGATVDEKGQYKAVLDALHTLGDTKILSSPRIMVVNGQEAKILVGSKEAYLTASTTEVGQSASTTETVNFVDVGIKLYVTPEISREGAITMKIRPEVSSSQYIDFGTATAPKKIPIVTTSEAETTVVVNDGTTIIIGGLRKDEKDETIKKIPILGDIPFLGMLARSTSREVKTADLVILLTPHLMAGDKPLTDLAEIKPKDGVTVQMYKGDLIKERKSSEDEGQ